jgi:hypothetical protein
MPPRRCACCSTHWADSPVQLRFMGTAQLLAVLSEAAPNNDRGTDDVWWQLHLAALRMMHLPDDFELVALNYCITYEVSPPSWQDPKRRVHRAGRAAGQPAQLGVVAAVGRRRFGELSRPPTAVLPRWRATCAASRCRAGSGWTTTCATRRRRSSRARRWCAWTWPRPARC